MSQSAADHVKHVQHAEFLLQDVFVYLLCFCPNYPRVFLCVLHLAFDHYSIINKVCIIIFDIVMEWISLFLEYKLAKFVVL